MLPVESEVKLSHCKRVYNELTDFVFLPTVCDAEYTRL